MGEEVPTPHLRWENPFLFPQAKQFSHYLGLCTMPFKKVGSFKIIAGAAHRPLNGPQHCNAAFPVVRPQSELLGWAVPSLGRWFPWFPLPM